MFKIFKELESLRKQGRIHKKLIVRTRMLFIISAVFGFITIYNTVLRNVNIIGVLLLAILGFLFGFIIFSRMYTIKWDEQKSVVQTGKMDLIGFVVLGLYIGFEILLKMLLKDFYPVSAGTFIMSGMFGVFAGRITGMTIEIQEVFEQNNTEEDK